MTYLELIAALRPYQRLTFEGGKIEDMQKTLDIYQNIFKIHLGKPNVITKACKGNLITFYKYAKESNNNVNKIIKNDN